jgi:hypothetical protein
MYKINMKKKYLIYKDDVMEIYLKDKKLKMNPINNTLILTIDKFHNINKKIIEVKMKLREKYGKINLKNDALEIENENNIIKFLNLYVKNREDLNELYLLYYKENYYLKNLKKLYNEYFKIIYEKVGDKKLIDIISLNFEKHSRAKKKINLFHSKFEEKIYNYILNNYDFDMVIPNVKLNVKNKSFLWADFIIVKKTNNKTLYFCLETDGAQHYEKTHRWYSEESTIRDKIKEVYFQQYNITLIRYRYNEPIKNLKKYINEALLYNGNINCYYT